MSVAALRFVVKLSCDATVCVVVNEIFPLLKGDANVCVDIGEWLR